MAEEGNNIDHDKIREQILDPKQSTAKAIHPLIQVALDQLDKVVAPDENGKKMSEKIAPGLTEVAGKMIDDHLPSARHVADMYKTVAGLGSIGSSLGGFLGGGSKDGKQGSDRGDGTTTT